MVDIQRQLDEAQRVVRERDATSGMSRAPGSLPLPPNEGAPQLRRAPSAGPAGDQGAVFDIAAIERDTSIAIDGAFDGRRRRRRAVLLFVSVVVIVFGGLLAALAGSYLPHG
jgi:hypothetical protein